LRGGGSGTVVGGTIEHGSIRLDYSYDSSRRVLQIGGQVIPLQANENVVLVDDVERSGGTVVKVLALDFSVDSQNPTRATMLGAAAGAGETQRNGV
jgi:hypothetical protein